MTNLKYYKQYSDAEEKEAYHRGFLQGYAVGYEDAMAGREQVSFSSDEAAKIPVEMMGLSNRAYNCLHRCGCCCVADVAGLSETQIFQMRNLGKVTAREIAGVLEDLGIHGTHWEPYLYLGL